MICFAFLFKTSYGEEAKGFEPLLSLHLWGKKKPFVPKAGQES